MCECKSKCEPHRFWYKTVMVLVFLWDWSLQSSCSWRCGRCGSRDFGEVGGRGIADAKGWGDIRLHIKHIRLHIKQTELSTLQVSFHQCNFCQRNNRKGKGKVYQLLVKHQDVRDGITDTQTVEAGEREKEWGLRWMFVLRKSQRGEIVLYNGGQVKTNCNSNHSKNVQLLNCYYGKWICFIHFVQ